MKKKYSTWFYFFVYRYINIRGLFRAKDTPVEEEEDEEEEARDEVKIKV